MTSPIATQRDGHLAGRSASPTRSNNEVGLPPKPPSPAGAGSSASTPSQCHRVATLHPPATSSPVHMKLSQSWHSHTVAAAFHTSGSFCLSQRALGSIHSAESGPAPSQLTRSAGSPLPSARISAA
eukprot:scaffold193233_cov28-Tisochrysis_lutea.AAC.3